MVSIAIRTPDHGKLAPWRFVHIQDRTAFAGMLHEAYRVDNPEPARLEIEAIDRFAHQAPALVVALSSPVSDSKIPIWEQELSAGAVCMNLLHAAHAMGFVGGWVTGWATYSDQVREVLARDEERVAGFIFIGTPAHDLEERPRPALDYVLSEWPPT